MRAFAHGDIAGEDGSARDVRMASDLAVVLHDGARVHDHIVRQTRAGAEDDARENRAAFTGLRRRREHGAGMDHRDEAEARRFRLLEKALPRLRAGSRAHAHESMRDAARGVTHAFMGVGSTSGTQPRQRLFEQAKAAGFSFVAVIHPSAVLAPSSQTGEGCAILAGVVLGTGARLADNVIVNTRAVVEHDCQVGSHAHIASGAVLAGDVSVGEGAHVGSGAVVRQGLRIGRRSVIGVGAAVVTDVPDDAVFAGVPARPLTR